MRRRGHRRRWRRRAWQQESTEFQRGHQITNGPEDRKAARGTKRVCQACEVRFYDLLREPVTCPSCGVTQVVVAASPLSAAGSRLFAAKSGWRRNAFASPDRVADTADPEATDNATEESPLAVSGEDVVLDEQEPDETDVANLVDHHDAEPSER